MEDPHKDLNSALEQLDYKIKDVEWLETLESLLKQIIWPLLWLILGFIGGYGWAYYHFHH